MAKSTVTYWNPLFSENDYMWRPIDGLEGVAEELTLSIDPMSGEYTRLTRFLSRRRHDHPRRQEPCVSGGDLYRQRSPLR